MNAFLNPFRAPSRAGTEWFSVGLASSFPDVAPDETGMVSESSDPRLCANRGPSARPGCKVFHVPKTDTSQWTEVEVAADDLAQDLTDQVLVFQYRGKFHAVDHVSAHARTHAQPFCVVGRHD
jgi:hypothetical protein